MKHAKSSKAARHLRTVLRFFVQMAAQRLLLGGLLGCLTVLTGMGLLGLSGWFITATALAGLSTTAAMTFNVFTPSAAIRLLALGRTAARYGERIVTHDATLAVLAALRERLFRSWAQPQAARYLLQRPARLLFRLTQDIDALESLYLRALLPLASALAAATLAAGMLGMLDGWLGLGMFVWLVLMGLGLTLWTARRARRAALRRARHLEQLRAHTIDLVAGQTELLMAGQLPQQCQRVARSNTRLMRAEDALHRLETRAGWLYALAGHASVAAVLLAVGTLVQGEQIGLPAAALALLLTLTALEPFAALRRGALDMARSSLAARRLGPQLQAPAMPASPPRQAPGSAPASHDTPTAFALDGVQVRHPGSAAAVLHDIHLRIAPGERVALIGSSGAGKSTLLALLAAELSAQAGRVQTTPCTWLTQRTELFQDSLRHNLLLAAPQASDAQLWQALSHSGLERTVRQLPAGLDTLLGEGGLGLSGGQARRLALARLLLHPATCWLLDEPTEGLDGATASDVLQRMQQHAGTHTVLIATHVRREAQLADRLLLLAHGRIVAEHRRGTAPFDAVLATLRQH